jgi:hypothetical protein
MRVVDELMVESSSAGPESKAKSGPGAGVGSTRTISHAARVRVNDRRQPRDVGLAATDIPEASPEPTRGDASRRSAAAR